MIIRSEPEMLSLGRRLARFLAPPAVVELVGDVGTGKTTLTRGLADGLGVDEPLTSPSFTISKRYDFPLPKDVVKITTSSTPPQSSSPTVPFGQLIHYDFYRLDDPGIMREELSEALSLPNSVVVVEWGDHVADLLPSHKLTINLSLLPDGARSLEFFSPDADLLSSLTKYLSSESRS